MCVLHKIYLEYKFEKVFFFFEKPDIKSTVLSMTAFRFRFEFAQNVATNVNCKL